LFRNVFDALSVFESNEDFKVLGEYIKANLFYMNKRWKQLKSNRKYIEYAKDVFKQVDKIVMEPFFTTENAMTVLQCIIGLCIIIQKFHLKKDHLSILKTYMETEIKYAVNVENMDILHRSVRQAIETALEGANIRADTKGVATERALVAYVVDMPLPHGDSAWVKQSTIADGVRNLELTNNPPDFTEICSANSSTDSVALAMLSKYSASDFQQIIENLPEYDELKKIAEADGAGDLASTDTMERLIIAYSKYENDDEFSATHLAEKLITIDVQKFEGEASINAISDLNVVQEGYSAPSAVAWQDSVKVYLTGSSSSSSTLPFIEEELKTNPDGEVAQYIYTNFHDVQMEKLEYISEHWVEVAAISALHLIAILKIFNFLGRVYLYFTGAYGKVESVAKELFQYTMQPTGHDQNPLRKDEWIEICKMDTLFSKQRSAPLKYHTIQQCLHGMNFPVPINSQTIDLGDFCHMTRFLMNWSGDRKQWLENKMNKYVKDNPVEDLKDQSKGPP
tara:strand:+ start:196 stop:1722 length:1527 start_codon:yes stop_codon:yes gene_type:complete